ncbi:C-type lectin domain family 3 member A-like [Ostrea edulis]|uniref:C-type lectin domain family 3 member A-like n=1 Tax=Ostrea edulis TaxID=37623 RepID=UPI0024AFED6E|nr:C-type lectin domain family 3 member A-like [Ostrea edulis]
MTSTLLEIGGSWEERWIHMRSLLQGYKRVWLGITDFLIDGVFLSASTASRVYYTSWKSGQPDGGQLESCGMFEPAEGVWSKHIRLMPKNGTWSDTSCDGQLEFVCEKKGSRRWRPMCPRYKKILKLFP